MLGELIHDGDEHAIDEEAAGGELHDRDGIEQIGGEGDAALIAIKILLIAIPVIIDFLDTPD